MSTIARRVARTIVLIGVVGLPLTARNAVGQQAVSVAGTVRDSTTGRPLAGAFVTLGAAGNARSTRSDETGAFTFLKVPVGTYTLITRRLGYEAASRTVDATPDAQPVVVSLLRVAMLDTIRVRATNQGIYGVVGTAADLRPLGSATIQIVGGSGKVAVDSLGRFYAPIKSPGAYLVRATAPGFDAQTMSVTVRRDEGIEIALLLDSATGPASHMLASALADFDYRMRVRRQSSAIVPRSELARDDNRQLVGALLRAPSFNAAVLRIGESACVFVDGQPRPATSLSAFDVSEVEAVETYTAKSEASGTLARRWPRGFPCPSTGQPRVAMGNDVVQWVVVWLKR